MKIKSVPHEVRFFADQNQTYTEMPLSIIFTSKPKAEIFYKNSKFIIQADKYKTTIINWRQYFNVALVQPSLVNNVDRIEKLQNLILKRDIISNLILSTLSYKNNIEILKTNQRIQVDQLENDTLLIDNLFKPKYFSMLNDQNKFFIESLHHIKNLAVTQNDWEFIEKIFLQLSEMNAVSYFKLLNEFSMGNVDSGIIKKYFSEFLE